MLTQTKIDAMKRITEEYKYLINHPFPTFGITIGLINENNIFIWKATILGPKNTPYQGGLFHLKITFPDDYPNRAPEIIFENPIYHLNVKFFVYGEKPLGHICLSTLNDWKKEYTMIQVLPEIFDLFIPQK